MGLGAADEHPKGADAARDDPDRVPIVPDTGRLAENDRVDPLKRVRLDEVLGAERAAVLLVRREDETERPRRLVRDRRERGAGEHHRRDRPLHIGRTESVEPVTVERRCERVRPPLRRRLADGFGVEMTAEGQVWTGSGPIDPNKQVGPVRLLRHDRGLGQAVPPQGVLHDRRGRRLVTRKIGTRCRDQRAGEIEDLAFTPVEKGERGAFLATRIG